jgi:hypothetical protein
MNLLGGSCVGNVMKTTIAALALLVAGSSAAEAKRAMPALRCGQLTAKIEQAKAAADAYTAKSYAAALAKKKLTPISLAATEVPSTGASKLAANQFLGPQIYEGYGGEWEFVSDKNGDVWAVDRAPHVTQSSSHGICGCAPITHGGAAPVEVQIVYTLPAGKKFRGHVKIAYDSHEVTYLYPENGNCPQPP